MLIVRIDFGLYQIRSETVTFAKIGKVLLYVFNKYFKINIQEFKNFLGNTIKRR